MPFWGKRTRGEWGCTSTLHLLDTSIAAAPLAWSKEIKSHHIPLHFSPNFICLAFLPAWQPLFCGCFCSSSIAAFFFADFVLYYSCHLLNSLGLPSSSPELPVCKHPSSGVQYGHSLGHDLKKCHWISLLYKCIFNICRKHGYRANKKILTGFGKQSVALGQDLCLHLREDLWRSHLSVSLDPLLRWVAGFERFRNFS